MLLIQNGHIKPMVGPELEKGSILLGDDGKIAAIGDKNSVAEEYTLLNLEADRKEAATILDLLEHCEDGAEKVRQMQILEQ